ncbi:MAG: winged helix DNA-binding domain-containing protein [Gemmatimonadaceae bacterium]
MTITQLRLQAQGIAAPLSTTPEAVVTGLGAIQAQDYTGALWSIGLRLADATRASVEQAIAEKSIVRTWPMRGTLHFVPAADARWMLELLAPRIIKGAEGRHRQLELDAGSFSRSRNILRKALQQQKVMTRRDIFAALEKGGIGTGGQRGIHILQQLSMECTLCYGPHAEKQPTFALFDDWIATSRTLEREDALRTIAERYFAGHGPATVRDFVWWSGLTVADAKVALQLAHGSLEKYEHEGADHWMARGLAVPEDVQPGAHLLPGFDEYMLGYTNRSAALPAKYADRVVPGGNGVFFSTLVLDGQVRGTWRRETRPKGIVIEASPFGRFTAAEKQSFTVPVERYARFLDAPVTIMWER